MNITAQILQKYNKVSIASLKTKAQETFNAWIRNRDKNEHCISCPIGKIQQAGHFFAAGKFPSLRFNEDNAHGQCIKCNFHEHGNLLNYREGLLKKIGPGRLYILELAASQKKHIPDNRYRFIEIIEQYKLEAHE